MPVQNNELLDDPLTFDRQRSFTGGMVSSVRVNLLGEDQGSQLWDVDIDQNVTLDTRRGMHLFGDLNALVDGDTMQGMWWFDSGTYQFLLVLAGGALYRGDDEGTWTLVDATAAPSTSAQGHGCQVVDRFYLSTGDGKGKVWTAAQINAGTAGTAITDGPTTVDSLVSMRYRMFARNAGTTDEVYCSDYLPTGATPWTLGGQPILPFRVGDGGGDPIVSMLPWKGLFSLVVFKRGGIWLVDTSTTSSVAAAAEITAAFSIQQVGFVGTVANRGVVAASNDLLFLAEDGIRSLAKTIEDGNGRVSDPISQPIHDLILRVNPSARDKTCSAFHNGRAVFAVALDSATMPNTLLVLNAKLGAWVVWTGAQPVAMVVTQFAGEPRKLMILDARGHVLELRDHVTLPAASDFRDDITGADVRVPWRVRTRGMTFGDGFSPKAPDHVEFEFDRSEAIIDIDVILDNDTSGIRLASNVRTGFPGWILAPDDGLPADYPDSTLPCKLGELKVKRIRYSLTHYQPAREIMFELREAQELTAAEEDESGALRARSVQAAAFLETMEAEQ